MLSRKAKYFISLVCIAFSASSEATSDTSQENCVQKAAWSAYMDVAADMIAKAKNSSITCYDADGKCGQKAALSVYMDVAADVIAKAKNSSITCHDTDGKCGQNEEMINKAKINFPVCDNCNNSQQQILDCSDLLHMGHNRSGVYTISPIRRLTEKKAFGVYCDMETDGGGWTVIIRRGDFQNQVDYFSKDWKSYKEGFGDVEKDFWLGNDNIFALTNQGIYSARFDMKDVQNNARYAKYDTFWIDDESSQYMLHISNYSGNAGDDMGALNNLKFSTKDQDNDNYKDKNCAQLYKIGGWYIDCSPKENIKLGWIDMKIRPRNFRA